MSRKRNSNPRSEDQADRYTLIRRAILGLDYWLYGKVRLWPFCDYLKILLSEPDPLIVTVWQKLGSGWKRVFSTHKHIETCFADDSAVAISLSSLAVACYKIRGRRSILYSEAGPRLARLFNHPHFQVEKIEELPEAGIQPSGRSSLTETSATRRRKTESTVDYWPIFDGVHTLQGASPRFTFSDLPIANLFGFVFTAHKRTAAGNEGVSHSPVCVLSPQQKEYFASASSSDPELVGSVFQRLFGQEAQDAFNTGAIVLAAPVAEIGEIASGQPTTPKALASRHRLYIPIHVEGVAWIVLLRFLSSKDEARWYEVFHFYHDAVPRIGAMLRAQAKATYLALLGNTLSEEIARHDTSTFSQRCNTRLSALNLQYPFAKIQIGRSSPGDTQFLSVGNERFSIQAAPNVSYVRTVDYDPLDADSIWTACQKAMMAEVLFSAEMRNQAHTIFNELPTYQIEAALSCDESQLTGEARGYVENAKRKTAILATSFAIPFEKPSALDEPQNRSVLGLLRWFHKNAPIGDRSARFSVREGTRDIPLESKEARNDAFTAIWNLWNNASKTYPGAAKRPFEIRAKWEADRLKIAFENAGELSPNRAKYLLGDQTAKLDESDNRGLQIIRSKVRSLDWKVSDILAAHGITTITLSLGAPNNANRDEP